MPPNERARLLALVEREPWAKAEIDRLAAAAATDGYSAALLFALRGGDQHLEVARRWLLAWAAKGGDIPMAKEKLHDEEFFRGGQPWISPVYYNVDIRPLVAYDWISPGLTPEERSAIEAGILTSARFRMKCMDRWTQTANLVFKPTFMVAVAGLVTQDRELLQWGFERKPGSPIGGYFPVLAQMLDPEGPWREAPIYPVAHRGIELMAVMSRLLALGGAGDAFSPPAGGGSPKALMDYYLDTAYPPERGPDGRRRIRVLTYGDGSTNAAGDLFLVGARKGDHSLGEALAVSWSASGDARYSAFLELDDTYRAALPDRPPLAGATALPPAPSKIWKSFGLAFLRSDESARYWESDRAMAASLMMGKGYGHDHRDKFGITFFGAGRLLYPDWNLEQYENPAVGWTRNTIAHNTLMVDEEDARDVAANDVRSDFAPDAKLVSVSAEGIFEGVRQTRTLVLTKRYLLDVVSARSARPRTYDWLLHGIGRLDPRAKGRFASTPRLGSRYARFEQTWSGRTDRAWAQRFSSEEGGVRVLMAEAPGTQVVSGVGADDNAMLVVRRDRVAATEFVAVHVPFRAGAEPDVQRVSVLSRREDELVVRIEGRGWTAQHRVPVVGGATPAATTQGETQAGPVLRADYRSSTPVYRVEAHSFRAGLDMRHGMIRHLMDEDGRERLGGKPLFTISADGKELLSERTEGGFTWPTRAPASLLAEIEGGARYRIRFLDDRFAVEMDRDWTRAERVTFTFPGAWTSDETPRWTGRVERRGKIAAAELAFGEKASSLCFELDPPQAVTFDGTGMRFEIGVASGDKWSAGFCRPGSLEAWRRAKP